MRSARAFVVPGSDHSRVGRHEHRTDHGIRAGLPASSLGEVERLVHESFIHRRIDHVCVRETLLGRSSKEALDVVLGGEGQEISKSLADTHVANRNP